MSVLESKRTPSITAPSQHRAVQHNGGSRHHHGSPMRPSKEYDYPAENGNVVLLIPPARAMWGIACLHFPGIQSKLRRIRLQRNFSAPRRLYGGTEPFKTHESAW